MVLLQSYEIKSTILYNSKDIVATYNCMDDTHVWRVCNKVYLLGENKSFILLMEVSVVATLTWNPDVRDSPINHESWSMLRW